MPKFALRYPNFIIMVCLIIVLVGVTDIANMPVLLFPQMTTLATLLGMIPMALGLEAGSGQYAALARAFIGGFGVSVVVTVLLVPAVYLLVHGRHQRQLPAMGEV
jgi:multidrug efflux pump subunit AcrB